MIEKDVLLSYEAKEIELNKNESLFSEGGKANFYYQILSGQVKMYNLTETGKEFVQGMFVAGQSFGEPPLLGNFEYPAGAMAVQYSKLYKLSKKQFLLLLKENNDIHLEFTSMLCKRLAYKAMIGREISVYPPDHRILTLLQYLRKQSNKSSFTVDLTRQQIAELTGLRVETVIRVVKKLETQKILMLENHKIIM